MSYFTTQVARNGSPSFSDVCLSPLHALCGGKTYVIIQDEQGDLSHAVSFGRPHLATQIALHIIGFLLTVVLFPVVLLGLLVKQLSSLDRENYGYIQLCIENKMPMLRFDNLSLRPKEKALSAAEVAKLEVIDYKTLSTAWTTVGVHSEKRDAVTERFKFWFEKEVPDTRTYTYIPPEELENAKIVLERNLKVITLGCEDPEIPLETKETALLRLYDASLKCSPTWVEESDAVALLFKKADSPREKLLRWVQQVKEEQIVGFVQKPGFTHWHGLNYARYMIGYECGLRYEQAAYDATIFNASGGPSKRQCLGLFLQNFPPRLYIEALTEKIRRGNPITPKSNGLDDDLNVILGECADKYAKEAGVDINDENTYDSGVYLVQTFYDKVEGGYQINEKGTEALLLQTELLGF